MIHEGIMVREVQQLNWDIQQIIYQESMLNAGLDDTRSDIPSLTSQRPCSL